MINFNDLFLLLFPMDSNSDLLDFTVLINYSDSDSYSDYLFHQFTCLKWNLYLFIYLTFELLRDKKDCLSS